MAKNLPRSLRNELEWAIGTLIACGSPSTDAVHTIRNATRGLSPLLAKRFGMFYDNSLPANLEPEQTRRIGHLMLALQDYGAGRAYTLYQPGEWDDRGETKQTAVLQIRCAESWKLRLQLYAERSGKSLSDLVRNAVDAYLADSPTWRSADPKLDQADEQDEDGD